MKSVTKTPTNETSHTSSVFLYKRAFLKNVITPTKNREYQIVGTPTITCNDRIIRQTLSKLKIHDNYNRGNKVIAMSPAKDKVCYHYDLKPQLYKGVIIQQSNSAKVKRQEKKEELPPAHWRRKFCGNRVWVFSIFYVFIFKHFNIVEVYKEKL